MAARADGDVQLTAAERAVVVAALRRSLDNSTYALMHLHPNHPHRAQVTVERRVIEELIAKLEPGSR